MKEIKRYNPKVSVIINSHNGKKFINNSINSVLKQSYKNFEIIFYDNKSDDNSYKEVKKFKSNKIKYFYSKKFLKLYHARDLAVKKAKGDLIAFLDVDDWWDVRKLEIQVKSFKDEAVTFSFTNYLIYDDEKKRIKPAFSNLPSGFITNELLKKNFIGMCTLIIRKKEYFKLKKGFDHTYEIIGDYDLCLRLSEKGFAKSINKNLSFYRWHRNNLSNTKRELNFLELIKWLKINKKFKKYSNFKFLENFSYFQLGFSYILGQKKILAIKLFSNLKIYFKLKLLILILLPTKLTKIIRNFNF